MAARLFPINVPLTIVWQFTKPDNTNFDITGYNPRLYYRSGNRETEVPSTMISKTGNTLSFTFPTTWPRFEGEYHLKLLLFQNNALWETFHYRQAWSFVRTAIPGSQEAIQQNAGETVHLYTCAEYYLFQPIIPTVDSDGYWVVNGTRVTDGSGNPVPSSHTVTYDAETNQIIIDQGRVDKNGNSIAQTITALDDALDNQQELYEAAEGTQSGSVSGDGSRWGSYKAAEAARNAARTTAEGTKNGSTAGDGSMWGEYKAAEAARNTARAASEGTKTGSVAGDGSMWGAFKEGEAARNEASENQEGTKAFSTESDGTRWGEYKNAERERDEARLAAEGSKQRSNAGDGTRWGDYKTAEGERDLQYAKEEGTAASEAHDGTRWGEYKAAEEERDASESRRDSTFNELASDMRSATSAANTAAGAANTAAAGANTAAGKANAAAGRAPYIGENGHWYAWDIESGQYADTGVAALSNSRYEVVSELPDEGDGNILYLVGPNQQGAYDEYVYTKDGEFVQVGSTYVDLEEKVSSDDIDNIIELTQEEFDALQSKDPRAMYIVTNAVPDSDHVGIASLVQTTVATADEGVNVWTCTLTNGQTFTLNVKNGSRGNSGYTGAAGELEVVNALNSDDATAALSAYQGKVLDGKIDQLGQEVEGIEKVINGEIWTSGKYLNRYNAEVEDANWGHTDYIPYTQGNDVIWKWGNVGAVESGRAICFYKSDKTFITNGYWSASGTTGEKVISAASIASDAGQAVYMRASFRIAEGASLSVGNDVVWENDEGLEKDVERLKEETQDLGLIGKVVDGLFLSPEFPSSQGFVRWETKGVESGGANNKMFVIYPNGQKVLRYKVGHASGIDAAVAFYSTDDLTLTGESTFISGVRAIDGISEGILDIPTNCKLIVVGDRVDILPLENTIVKTSPGEKDLRDRLGNLEEKYTPLLYAQRQSIVAGNPFRFDKFYGHLWIESINSQCVVPLQSVFDIMISKRLGFKYIEGNIRVTSDGKAIVTHAVSGKFGGMFKLAPGSSESDDIADTMINTKTLAWIKQNVVYNSSIPKFCVAPLTPEEFCHACKLVGILPMIGVSSYDKNAYDAILGRDNYIADRLTVRGDCSAPILLYNPSLTTKEQIIAACDAVGAPVGFTFTNNLADYTDAELRDIVESMHKKGYLVGQVCCYQNEIATQRGWSLNFDYGCSNYQVNDFGRGNLLDIDGTFGFSDFYTSGTISDGKITIVNSQIVRPDNEPSAESLGVGVLTIKFSGTIKITMGPRLAHELTSDGENPMVFSTYYFQQSPSFLLQGIGTSGAVIEEIHFKSSKV